MGLLLPCGLRIVLLGEQSFLYVSWWRAMYGRYYLWFNWSLSSLIFRDKTVPLSGLHVFAVNHRNLKNPVNRYGGRLIHSGITALPLWVVKGREAFIWHSQCCLNCSSDESMFSLVLCSLLCACWISVETVFVILLRWQKCRNATLHHHFLRDSQLACLMILTKPCVPPVPGLGSLRSHLKSYANVDSFITSHFYEIFKTKRNKPDNGAGKCNSSMSG